MIEKMVKSKKDLEEKSLAMTAFFETSNGYPDCFGVTAGNWDGAGLSHGVLQYNFKTGSLQPLWNHMNNNHLDLCFEIFGAKHFEWEYYINADFAQQTTWCNEITDPNNKHQTLQPWKDMFMQLGTSEPSIAKQIEMTSHWRTNAEKWFFNLGLYSRRGYALLWDISVQMGRLFPQNLILQDFRNINTTGKTREQIEKEKLIIIVNRCSNYENNINTTELNKIVYDRKIGIVNGTTTAGFNIAQYDLEYEPAFMGGIFSGN